MALLLVADAVRTLDAARPDARAVLVVGRRVAWVGDDPDDAPATSEPVTRIDLDGALLQPAFVDAHVHLTATGLGLSGLDLRDCRSVADCLAAVRAIADVLPGRVIWGSGWDDFRFPEHRPPTADELAEASGGRPVLLSRTDGHSSVIDRRSLEAAPLARASGVERDGEGRPTGVLRREANHVARRWFFAELPEAQLAAAREAVVRHALALGIATVHEMNGPDLMGEKDYDAWCEGTWPLEVMPYWGAADLDFLASRGQRRIGEFFLDGSLGSRTAALAESYCDHPGCGRLYEATDDLVHFATEATKRRVQVAFHCIGDRAVHQAVEVLEGVARTLGPSVVAGSRHRLEHCELVPAELIPRIAALSLVASVQPAFDRAWGGPDGMYAARLGRERAARMNPFRPLREAGVVLAFGSDANVTPMDPWGGVRAAVEHTNPAFALDEDAALRAAIVGGRLAGRQDDVGHVEPGHRADLAAFALRDGAPAECVLTVVRGRVAHGDIPAASRR